MARISSSIRIIPGFPKQGIMFRDRTMLLLDPKAFRDAIDWFVERYSDKNISVVAGIEARGFIFGPPIAFAIGAKFVAMRKPEKLPERVEAEVVECACVIELPELKGRDRLGEIPLFVLLKAEVTDDSVELLAKEAMGELPEEVDNSV